MEVPVERIVEKRVEELRENVIYHDRYIDVDVQDLAGANYEGVVMLETEVREFEQDVYVDNPIYIENEIVKYVDVPVERRIEIPVEKIVEVPVEHVVERPVYVENIIEKEIRVPVERVIEVPVEHVVE